MLSSALDNPYLSPILLFVPMFFANINACLAAKEINETTYKLNLEDCKNKLKSGSSFVDDTLIWVILTLLPDMFSACLQPKIKNTLEKIKFHLIWDNQLSNAERLNLIEELTGFSNARKQLTRIKTLSVLADLLAEIDVNDLPLSNNSQKDQETKEVFIEIKRLALRQLKEYADIKARNDRLSYFCANYFLWNIGYSQSSWLEFLFYPYKVFKIYATVMFYKSVLSGIYALIDRLIQEKNCYAQGKVWKWMDVWENYTCSVCGDLPVFVKDIWTVKDFFRSYLEFPRTYDDLMKNIINRENQTNDGKVFLKFNLNEITVLDLSLQYQLFNQTNNNLDNFLSKLSNKLVSLKNISVLSHTLTGSKGGIPQSRVEYISYQDFSILMNFVKKFKLQLDSLLITKTLMPDFDNLLSETVANSTIKTLKLHLAQYGHGFFEKFSKVLSESSVTSLDFDTSSNAFWNDNSLSMLADNLPLTLSELGDLWVNINSSTVYGCQSLASQLLNRTALKKLRILIDGKSALNCYMAFAKAGKFLNPDFYFIFFLHWQNHDDITVLSKSISDGSFPALKVLNIGFDNSFMPSNETILLTLSEAISHSSLQEFGFSALNKIFLKNMNQSKILHQLVDALDHSNISRFTAAAYWGDEAGKQFAKELSKLSKIQHLHFDFHPAACEGPKAMLHALLDAPYLTEFLMGFERNSRCTEVPYENIISSNITRLDLDSYNYESEVFSDNIMNQFLKKLNQSKIVQLDLGVTFDVTAISALSEGLSSSSVEQFWLAHRLTDQNAEILARGLVVNKMKHHLWVDFKNKNSWSIDSNTNLTFFIVNATDNGILTLCRNLPYTQIARVNFLAWSADNELN